MKEIIQRILKGIYRTVFFVVGIIILYIVSQVLSITLTFIWEKSFGYDPFLRESALAVPGAIIISIVSGLIVAGLSWRKSRALALGALVGIIPLIFMYSFA